jgi:hypothetical protein
MGVKSLLFLFLMSATATAFAAPPAAKKRPPEKRPATVAAPDCKTQKTRLHQDEKVLRARQQLAYEECRASARPDSSSRCEDLKRQQKAQRQEFKEHRKLALGQCKGVKKEVKQARAPKGQGKKAARSR